VVFFLKKINKIGESMSGRERELILGFQEKEVHIFSLDFLIFHAHSLLFSISYSLYLIFF
jgi:hypothetical protein